MKTQKIREHLGTTPIYSARRNLAVFLPVVSAISLAQLREEEDRFMIYAWVWAENTKQTTCSLRPCGKLSVL